MEKERKNIDDFFKEELGNYTETPPAASWQMLQKKLGSTTTKGFRFTHWLGYTAQVLIVVTVGVMLGKKYMGNAGNQNGLHAGKTIESIQAVPTVNPSNIQAQPQEAGKLTEASVPGITNGPQAGTARDNMDAANNTANATTTRNNIANTSITTKTTTGNPIADNRSSVPTRASHVAVTTYHASKYAPLSAGHTGAGKKHNAPVTGKNNAVSTTKEPVAYQAPGKTSLPSSEEGAQAATDDKTIALQSSAKDAGALPAKVDQSKQQIEKKETAAEQEQPAVKKQRKPGFSRLEAGLKAGYERGLSDGGATKYLGAAYLQYNLTEKWSLLTQPSVKYATISKRAIGSTTSYFKENGDSTVNMNGSPTGVYLPGSGAPSFYITKFHYGQTHDSVVKSNTFGGTYTEYELPVLLQRKVSPSISLYAGVNVSYSKVTGITENTFTQAGIATSADSFAITRTAAEQPVAPPVSSVIRYTGYSYSDYAGQQYHTSTAGTIRVGYMLGLSYEYSSRWLMDVLVQQTPTKPDVQGGYNINIPLSSVYCRVALGYKLIK
jgi:hypothetical protein